MAHDETADADAGADWPKGFVHVYTGDGKGKTTAALGLALRAAGAGLKVFIAQFVKGMEYSEHKALQRLTDMITVKQFGRRCFIRGEPESEDVELARKGLEEAREAMASGEFRLVVLDEANIAVFYKLFTAKELIEAIGARRGDVEVVATGRKAAAELLEFADLVTEMREVKHYYQQGVEGRTGIEK